MVIKKSQFKKFFSEIRYRRYSGPNEAECHLIELFNKLGIEIIDDIEQILKPCPMCGAEPNLDEMTDIQNASISCPICGLNMSKHMNHKDLDARKLVINQWNQRTLS